MSHRHKKHWCEWCQNPSLPVPITRDVEVVRVNPDKSESKPFVKRFWFCSDYCAERWEDGFK